MIALYAKLILCRLEPRSLGACKKLDQTLRMCVEPHDASPITSLTQKPPPHYHVSGSSALAGWRYHNNHGVTSCNARTSEYVAASTPKASSNEAPKEHATSRKRPQHQGESKLGSARLARPQVKFKVIVQGADMCSIPSKASHIKSTRNCTRNNQQSWA